jgi:hypothetical protein
MQGEAMDFPAETLDMAFLLKTDAEEEKTGKTRQRREAY